MNSRDATPPRTPPRSGTDAYGSHDVSKRESGASDELRYRPISEINLPFRRSNASLSALFASTSLANSSKRASSPLIGALSHKSSTDSGLTASAFAKDFEGSSFYRDTIIRSFAPHVALLPSTDTEDLLAEKGYPGGFLQLVRPYGEKVPGKVTIRDGGSSSKAWDNFSVRFTRWRDGLEGPRPPERLSLETRQGNHINAKQYSNPATAAPLRTGGDIAYIEESVAKHLHFYESQFNAAEDDELLQEIVGDDASTTASAFHSLFLKRLLSGLPVTPHETFSHPVACVIAISSHNPDPIEQLRTLYTESSAGDQRLPQWINNDFLRYYVLVHDEDNDDIQRSMSLFEQMKRHFGIHCHMLKLRSAQCVPSDEDCVQLPTCEWLAAAEELAEIRQRENEDDLDQLGPFLFESDEASIRNFVRELVTQSVVPVMERCCATWNDQVASRRRGIGGRFLSLSKKWTPFAASARNSSSPSSGGSGSNYDSLQGFYRPDTPEALLRKLADYSFMLRDFKLAQSTYDLLRSDYNTDKAWKYAAGANEMTAISSLLVLEKLPARTKADSIDNMLEQACYCYMTRCNAPYYALRTLTVAVELLALRGGSGADDAARWAGRISELDLVGMTGHALLAERIGACFAARKGAGSKQWGSRRRKAALWDVLATQDWVRTERNKQAERTLTDAFKLYHVSPKDLDMLPFDAMKGLLQDLRDAVTERKGAMEAFAGMEGAETMVFDEPEPRLSIASKDSQGEEKVDIRKHRMSVIGMDTVSELPQ